MTDQMRFSLGTKGQFDNQKLINTVYHINSLKKEIHRIILVVLAEEQTYRTQKQSNINMSIIFSTRAQRHFNEGKTVLSTDANDARATGHALKKKKNLQHHTLYKINSK